MKAASKRATTPRSSCRHNENTLVHVDRQFEENDTELADKTLLSQRKASDLQVSTLKSAKWGRFKEFTRTWACVPPIQPKEHAPIPNLKSSSWNNSIDPPELENLDPDSLIDDQTPQVYLREVKWVVSTLRGLPREEAEAFKNAPAMIKSGEFYTKCVPHKLMHLASGFQFFLGELNFGAVAGLWTMSAPCFRCSNGSLCRQSSARITRTVITSISSSGPSIRHL
jgi:hypothetical protein